MILQGDCLEQLKKLPDCSVDMCVTSPPYYALRNYETGEWQGGDPNCDHSAARHKNRFDYAITQTVVNQKTNPGSGFAIYDKICPTCGAVYVDKQIGLESTPYIYIYKLTEVFHEVMRVLKDDGTLWLNIGDSYAAERGGTHQPAETLAGGEHGYTKDGSTTNRGRESGYNPARNASSIGLKHKDMIGIPWMLAFALRDDGWYLRQDIIWAKGSCMPESVKDRCTKSHEYIFLMSKNPKYYYDYEAIQEDCVTFDLNVRDRDNSKLNNTPGKTKSGGLKTNQYEKRNKRDVWHVNTQPLKEAHFATYPEKLIEPCILAGSRVGGVVLDPFFGSGTTGVVATRLNRDFIGIELNPEYIEIAKRRLSKTQLSFEGLI